MHRPLLLVLRQKKNVGWQTLERLETYGGYHEWIFREVEPYLGERVLEFGSGIGSISRMLLDRDQVWATDLRPEYVHILNREFGDLDNVTVLHLDITNPPPDLAAQRIDTIVSSNVVEHIEDDVAAFRAAWNLLEPGGRLITLTPACPDLYSNLDRNLEHFRRYDRDTFVRRLREAGFEIEDTWYMNTVGGFGWWAAGRILRQGVITDFNIVMHRFIEPISKFVDKIFGKNRPFGLSIIAIARKPEQPAAAST